MTLCGSISQKLFSEWSLTGAGTKSAIAFGTLKDWFDPTYAHLPQITVSDLTEPNGKYFALPEGKILFLPFDEGSGTIAYDHSGYGNNGTIVGATWVDGKYGKALSFNGSTDNVQVNDSDNLDLVDAVTMTAWIYPTQVNVLHTIIEKNAAYDRLRINAGKLGWRIFWSDASNTGDLYTDDVVCVINTWQHVACTYSKSTGKIILYVNGVAVKTFTGYTKNIIVNTEKVFIGSHEIYDFFNGVIDEARIYNRALSPAEILSLYNNSLSSQNRISMHSYPRYVVNCWVPIPRGNVGTAESQLAEDMRYETCRIILSQRSNIADFQPIVPVDMGVPRHELNGEPRVLRYEITLIGAHDKVSG